ncbi:DUF2274 domain-containing protein [Altererythrobacter sp. KTW20L]|uniref:DUF2274 domain-containing protein n=1 Tax=Altererythrobacter sp. KTW20L TaxID=2942210 RepID=UPI0020BEE7E5|nr:DUF2274 domain-containing protein [Altererythrobacter sp. KTW20L]MCL6250092.1 DUF2274 domain-containing protein [Altererythrobacter sp. KTW20L]
MTRLKLADIADEKPVRMTLEIPAKLHRDLAAYAVAVNGGDPKGAPTVERLAPAMLERFITTDRAFAKARRTLQTG